MKSLIKQRARDLLEPGARILAGWGVAPDHITAAGAVVSLISGIALGFGQFAAAWWALLAGGLCDMLDGAVARQHEPSRFGAFLDSTVDRFAELFFFAGALVYFNRVGETALYPLLALLAAGGSLLVSYTRARAEGLGLDCRVGIMERPERVVLLLIALPFGALGLKIAFWTLTPLVFYTSWQRIAHVYRETRRP